MTSKPGGHSTPRSPSNDETEFLTSDKVRNLITSSPKLTVAGGGGAVDSLVPILLTTQVVAGTVYQVKYKVINKNGETIGYIDAKIFKPLPCNEPRQNPELMNLVSGDNCTADSPLHL